MNKTKNFIKEVFTEVEKNDLFEIVESLSFRVLMAIVPTIFLLTAIFGLFFGREVFFEWLFFVLEGLFGQDLVVFEKAVEGTFDLMTGFFFSLWFVILALWSSLALINKIREKFYSIFRIEVVSSNYLKRSIKNRLFSFLYAFLFLFLLLIMFVLQGIMSFFSGIFKNLYSETGVVFIYNILNGFFFFLLVSFIFGVIYWFMSAGTLHFRAIVSGCFLSALLFVIFNSALSLYVSYSATLGLFGASGFILVFLIWIYYSAFTLFLGGVVSFVVNRKYIEKGKLSKNVYM